VSISRQNPFFDLQGCQSMNQSISQFL